MQITKALERLQTGNPDIISFNQLGSIDIITKYPVLDISRLKKPMLYYCFSGDWAMVALTLSKPYEKALSAITLANEEMRCCRVQIEIFGEKYFHPPQVSILSDPRSFRIPLVNLLRYYAMWKFVAQHSERRHITLERVEEDFKLIVDSVLERYLELVSVLADAMMNSASNGNNGEMFENLRWLQKVVDVPATVFDTKHRKSLVAALQPCSTIEAGIENRITTELPPYIELLKRANHNFTLNAEANAVSAPFDRRHFYEIDTEHADIINEYAGVESIHESLYALKSPSSDSTWEVSTNTAFNAAFNTVSLRDVHGHLAGALPVTPDQAIYELLFPFNLAFGDAPDMLSDLRKLLDTEPFAENPMHPVVLVHLFFPFYVTGLQFDRVETSHVKFMEAANKLRGCLLSLPKHELDDLLSVAVRSEIAWPNCNLPIGFAYQMLMKLGQDLLRGTSKDGASLLVESCGSRCEKMNNYLASAKINKLFLDSALCIENETRSKFAYEHYEEYGFIVSERTVMSLAIEDMVIPNQTGTTEFAPTKTVDIRILLAREIYPQETINRHVNRKQNYFANHEAFMNKWKAKWPEIIENCHARSTDLIERLCVPDEPTTADFLARLKVIGESKTLTSKIPEVPLVIDAKDKNAHERYMIGRLVVLGLSLEMRDIDSVAWLCGFRSKDKIRYIGLLPSPPDRSDLERYLNTLGLRSEDITAPLDSKRINLREQAFLQDSPWRK